MHERDENLMLRLAEGEARHLEPLVRRHGRPLLAFISRMVGDEHLGQDLFQEVFLAVWSKRGLYRFPRPFKPWLYAIAVNTCRTHFRRRTLPVIPQHDTPFEHVSAPLAPPALERAAGREMADRIDRIVRGLPEQQRTVLVLRIWGGLPYSGIAEATGLREATVRSHMHHALAGVRRALDAARPRCGPVESEQRR